MPHPIVNLKAVHKCLHLYRAPRNFTKDEIIMTQLLEKALAEVYKLPPEKQDTIAAVILEKLEDERLWDQAFAESQDNLLNLHVKSALTLRQDASKKWELMSCELISNS